MPRAVSLVLLLMLSTACSKPSGDEPPRDPAPSRFVPPKWSPGSTEELDARKLCERFAMLESKDGGQLANETEMKKCVKEMAELRKSDKPTYDCLVECGKQKTQDDAMGCIFACVVKSKDMKKP